MFCFKSGGEGYKACKAIFDVLAPVTLGTSENIRENASLYEVNSANAPTVYIEVDFHDVSRIAKWIIENTELIGETIAKGVCNYYGVKYVEKVVEKPVEKVETEKETKKLYRVQIGAYAVRKNAEKMLNELKAAGFNGFIKYE